ncbi:response regulator [Rufibacter roseus]|uniref:Response regulator n=1 Tax=Rufibacter roseus TaxID=1567108 RepID=A0ABW2DLW9_9BACT|nr:response regulator [Rufibacter roseus]
MPSISHILLVDDDDVNNFLNSRLLKRLAVAEHVEVSPSGEAGLRYLNNLSKSGETDSLLIFLDINMPMMNGFEFLDKLRNQDLQNLKPVITMLTTSTNEKDLTQLRNYPEVAGFLNKPLSEEKVTAVINEHFAA